MKSCICCIFKQKHATIVEKQNTFIKSAHQQLSALFNKQTFGLQIQTEWDLLNNTLFQTPPNPHNHTRSPPTPKLMAKPPAAPLTHTPTHTWNYITWSNLLHCLSGKKTKPRVHWWKSILVNVGVHVWVWMRMCGYVRLGIACGGGF